MTATEAEQFRALESADLMDIVPAEGLLEFVKPSAVSPGVDGSFDETYMHTETIEDTSGEAVVDGLESVAAHAEDASNATIATGVG